MNVRLPRACGPALVLVLASVAPAAPVAVASPPQTVSTQESPLVGTWTFVDGARIGSRLELRADRSCTLDDESGRWKAFARDGLRLQVPSGTVRLRYALAGDELTVEVDGRRARLARGARGGADGPAPPVSVDPAGSPFRSRVPAIDARRFVGAYEARSIRLVLWESTPGLAGTLERGGARWSVAALAAEWGFAGAAATASGDVPFELLPEPDGLRLRAGDLDALLFRREGAYGVGPARERRADAPGTRAVEDATGRLTFDLPSGAEVVEDADGRIAIAVAEDGGGAPVALTLRSRRLERDERGHSPARILAARGADWRDELEREGIELLRVRRRPVPLRGAGRAGAQQEFVGALGDGTPVAGWVGCTVAQGSVATLLGVELGSGGEAREAGARVLESVRFRGAERSQDLEHQIACRRVWLQDAEGAEVVHEFRSDGGVERRTEAGESAGPSGWWSVVGATLVLELDGVESRFELSMRRGRVAGVVAGGRVAALE